MKLTITVSILQLLALSVGATKSARSTNGSPPIGVEKDVGQQQIRHANRALQQSDINVDTDLGVCGATVSFPLETDATAVPASGSLFPVGTTTVEVNRLNGSTYSFSVTVVDNEPPVLVVQDTIYELGANGIVTGNVFVSGALVSQSDNCGVSGGVGVTGPRDYSCVQFRTNPSFPITVIQDDVNGNESRVWFTATVTDPMGACDTPSPSQSPSLSPSSTPSFIPSFVPSSEPSLGPSTMPSSTPTFSPSLHLSSSPTSTPTRLPSAAPSSTPSSKPSVMPSFTPTSSPSLNPSSSPSLTPTSYPSLTPTSLPSSSPSLSPTATPSLSPSLAPSSAPSVCPPQYAFRCGNEVHVCTGGDDPLTSSFSSLRPADTGIKAGDKDKGNNNNNNDQTKYSFLDIKSKVCQELINGQCTLRCPSGKRITRFEEYHCDGSSSVTGCQGKGRLLRGSEEY